MKTTLCCSPWRASPGTSVLGICHAVPSPVPRRICWHVVSAICCTDTRWQNSRPLVFQYAFWQMQIPITHSLYTLALAHTDAHKLFSSLTFVSHSLSFSLARSARSSIALFFGYNFLLSLGWICGGWRVEGELSWQRYASTFISLYALHNVPLCLQFWILLSKSLAYCFSAVYIHMYTYIYCLYICLYMHIYISIYIYTYIESSIYIYIYISPPPSLTSSSFVSDDCFAVSVFFLFFLFFLFFCLILNMWCSMLCSARFYSIMFFELFLCIEWELCFSPSDWVFPFQMTL